MGISVGESKRNHRGASSKHKSGMHGQSLGRLLGQAGDDDGKWRLCAQREESLGCSDPDWTRYLSGQLIANPGVFISAVQSRVELRKSMPCT